VLPEREEREENVDPKESKDLTDPVDPLVPSDLPEKLENVDTPELRETKDGWDLQVCPETPDLRDKLVNWELQDPPETWDQEDAMAAAVIPVKMVKLDPAEFPVNVEPVDPPEAMAEVATLDHQDPQDHLDTLHLPTHHSQAYKELKDPTQLKVIMEMKLNPMVMKLMLSTKLPGPSTAQRNPKVPRPILVLLAVTFLCVMTTNWRAELTSSILMENL